jgi:hypothetical protein
MNNTPVYASDPFAYDFKAALKSVSQSPPQGADDDYPAPTREQLIRHLEKFMPKDRDARRHHRQAVEALAADYGIDLHAKPDVVELARSRTRSRASISRQNKRPETDTVVEGAVR